MNEESKESNSTWADDTIRDLHRGIEEVEAKFQSDTFLKRVHIHDRSAFFQRIYCALDVYLHRETKYEEQFRKYSKDYPKHVESIESALSLMDAGSRHVEEGLVELRHWFGAMPEFLAMEKAFKEFLPVQDTQKQLVESRRPADPRSWLRFAAIDEFIYSVHEAVKQSVRVAEKRDVIRPENHKALVADIVSLLIPEFEEQSLNGASWIRERLRYRTKRYGRRPKCELLEESIMWDEFKSRFPEDYKGYYPNEEEADPTKPQPE